MRQCKASLTASTLPDRQRLMLFKYHQMICRSATSVQQQRRGDSCGLGARHTEPAKGSQCRLWLGWDIKCTGVLWLWGMKGMSAGGSHCCECAVPRAVTKSSLAEVCGFTAVIELLMGMPSGVPDQFFLEHWQRGKMLNVYLILQEGPEEGPGQLCRCLQD